jgi:23S rRNA (cytosine1962-C5)-methyltransferase
MSYALIDSGNEQKLERFGDYTLVRPCSQAVWKPAKEKRLWEQADAVFSREPANKWKMVRKLPASWVVEWGGVKFKIAPTDFGHLGVFPEHALLWKWMAGKISKGTKVLNLFAYSGGATLAAALAGAEVCHLDASKTIVAWARENAALNELEKAPIRWIVDDVLKFLKREIRRGVRYEGIILDPPTFGRGNQGEVFKIERDLTPILEMCRELLSAHPKFLILSSHTPGYTPLVMHHLMTQAMAGLKGTIEAGEMVIPGPLELPSGTYARWF